ncbi:hypothetical protein [Deinococcus sp.]|uniref:hypothetical protein n=1 Tax=Deinococcus sp. TaxID=47478 RepID=UPI003B59FB01
MNALRLSLFSLTAALALASCGTTVPAPEAAAPEVQAQTALSAQATAGPGSLDPAYKTGFGGFGSLNNLASHVKVLPNGKTLVVYAVNSGTILDQFIVVRRYNADGTLDRNFADGVQATLSGAFGGMKAVNPEAIEVTPEGRIFIAATGFNPTFPFTTERPIIFALTPNGGLDPFFSVQGRFPESASFPLSDGNGNAANPTSAADLSYDPATKKLTLGGTIDPSNGRSFFWTLTFNVDQTNIRKENFVKESGSDLRLDEIERLPSGETVMAGGIFGAGGLPSAYLARQLDNGLILGKRPVGIGNGAFVNGLKLDGGKALLAGSAFPTSANSTQGFVARLNLDSLFLDTGFGVNGVRFISKDVRDLAIAKDHKLIAVGGDGKRIMAARLFPEGQFDTSFGTGGLSLPLQSIASDSTEFAIAVDLDAQGRILLGGIVKRPGINDRNRVARLLP